MKKLSTSKGLSLAVIALGLIPASAWAQNQPQIPAMQCSIRLNRKTVKKLPDMYAAPSVILVSHFPTDGSTPRNFSILFGFDNGLLQVTIADTDQQVQEGNFMRAKYLAHVETKLDDNAPRLT